MPFTLSHVAAVLPASRVPALRDPLIMSAFAIGAMSPDVPYFVPADIWWAWGHEWTGLVAQDIPVTLALVAGFWLVLASPLRALTPAPLRARLPRKVLASHRDTVLRTLALLVLAAGVGAATHIVWDAFTHEGRFGVMAVGWLQAPHVVGPVPAYRVLQYASSAVGLGLIAWTLVRWYRRTPASTDPGRGLSLRWQAASALGVISAGALAWWSVRGMVPDATTVYGLRELLYGGLTRSVASMTAVVVVAAVAARLELLRVRT